jgi:phosphate:Na+ symporter
MDQSHERIIGSYFHVLNDLERIGDHAENLHEIGVEMIEKKMSFSDTAKAEIKAMSDNIMKMFDVSKDVFENLNKDHLPALATLEESVDEQKKELTASHFTRLADGNCNIDLSPYYSSVIVGLERVADHLVNVGYSILNPTGSQKINN